VASKNQCRDESIKHRANIQVSAKSAVYTFEMRDFSESGRYLFCSNTGFVRLHDQVKIQTLEFEGAPIIDALVARLDDNSGFAVEFLQ